MKGQLISLDKYDEGKSIDQPFTYRLKAVLADEKDEDGDTIRKNIKFSTNFKYNEPIDNSYGSKQWDQPINGYSDKKGYYACTETGMFK